MLARKRADVLRLRNEGRIDDTVLRQVQARLDIEEVLLTRREEAEEAERPGRQPPHRPG